MPRSARRDLDSGRQHEWHQRGGSLVAKVQSLDRHANEPIMLSGEQCAMAVI